MPYPTLDSYNTSEGLHVVFYYVSDVVPAFVPMVLLSLWLVATLGSFFAQRNLQGRGDFMASFAAGSYITTIVAIVMSLVPNLIRISTVVFTIALSIVATFLLFLGRDRSF